jgi:hypothetical protein
MKKIVPDEAETELPEFPELDKRIQPPSDDLRGLGHNHLAPPPEPHAPELPPGAENVVAWDDNPVEEGHSVPHLLPEDEAEVDAELTEEGLDEAERDLRKNARQSTPTVSGPDDL